MYLSLQLLDEKLGIIFQDIRIGEGSLKGAPVPQEMNKHQQMEPHGI